MITFYEDLPFDDPHFAALQWLGARGLNKGYKAEKDAKLTKAQAAEKHARVARYHEGRVEVEVRDGMTTSQLAALLYGAMRA